MGSAFDTRDIGSPCAETSVEELDEAFQDLHVALARWAGRRRITSDVCDAFDSVAVHVHAACISADQLVERVKQMLATLSILTREDFDQRSEIEARILSLATEAYDSAS